MTAEIALLNKQAVALAADSAVTIRTSAGVKILPSANKIFALSKYHPVGVMVYGNAQLLGVPWELLVKAYRKQLGKQSFSRLEDYALNFLQFMERAGQFFPPAVQEAHARDVVGRVFENIRNDIESSLRGYLEHNSEITELEVEALVAEIVADFFEAAAELELQPEMSPDFIAEVRDSMVEYLHERISATFEDLIRADAVRQQLVDIAVSWLCKAVPSFNDGDSGLVVAGFGEDDVFPSIRSYKIEGLVRDRLIYSPKVRHDVSSGGASIIPFAQTDVVHTFMEGVDEQYQLELESALSHAFRAFVDAASAGSGKKGKHLTEFRQALSLLANSALTRFKASAQNYRATTFAQPTVSVVSILTKDRLAAMAESLVDITALRRQFSMTEESVGGPVDVAVISKGDGLVWIKRKHYFDKALNPQFFHNYFGEG